MRSMKMNKAVIESLKYFSESLETGTVFQRFRVVKVMKNDDGTYKRVVSDPKKGISTDVFSAKENDQWPTN